MSLPESSSLAAKIADQHDRASVESPDQIEPKPLRFKIQPGSGDPEIHDRIANVMKAIEERR